MSGQASTDRPTDLFNLVELPDFIDVALEKIPHFTAVKFADPNVVRLSNVMRRFSPDRLKVFVGLDQVRPLPTRASRCH